MVAALVVAASTPALAFWGPTATGDGNVKLMVDCEAVLKRQMKNPRSYKRVEVVTQGRNAAMTYRATNSFGGVVTERAVCVDGKTILPVR